MKVDENANVAAIRKSLYSEIQGKLGRFPPGLHGFDHAEAVNFKNAVRIAQKVKPNSPLADLYAAHLGLIHFYR